MVRPAHSAHSDTNVIIQRVKCHRGRGVAASENVFPWKKNVPLKRARGKHSLVEANMGSSITLPGDLASGRNYSSSTDSSSSEEEYVLEKVVSLTSVSSLER